MQSTIFSLISLIAPISLFVFALYAISPMSKRHMKVDSVINLLGVLGMFSAFLTALSLYNYGNLYSPTLGWEGIGFSIRIDALSVTIFSMISILAFVVMRFSGNYLDGDMRRRSFLARMATTIGAVQLLVLSGNLFQILVLWVITSFCLHFLLVFYKSRPQAVAAARKKFIVARLADLALLFATVLIYVEFGTADLQQIFSSMEAMATINGTLTAATVLLVFAALFKSAQFPSHSWLIEVVETPTPVSALLHAGLLNAGPFLMVRMSLLINESTSASMMLILVGGFTAAYASTVYLTQPSIKVGLGYSSIAHMGFSLLLCGFGVFSAAILHVVAHSFYKAHSFLSSGSVVDLKRARKVNLTKREGKAMNVVLSILSSIAIFSLFAFGWGLNPREDFNLMAAALIIVMGLSQIFNTTFDGQRSLAIIGRSMVLALFVCLSFFGLEHAAASLLQNEIPVVINQDILLRSTILTIMSLYFLIVILQLFSPRFKNSAFAYKWGVHLRNGFYVNVVFDRWIGSLKHEKFKWANLSVKEEEQEVVEPILPKSISTTSN